MDRIGSGDEQAASTTANDYVPQLSFHMKAAAILPLPDDVFTQKWLLHTSADIVNQALHAVSYSDVDALAVHLRDEKEEFFSAARLWSTLGFTSNDSFDRRREYVRRGLNVLRSVADGTPKLKLEFEIRMKVFQFFGTKEEKDAALDFIGALDKASLKQLGSRAASATSQLANAYIGFCESKYCFDISVAQLTRGAMMAIECGLGIWRKGMIHTGYSKW